jgi:hypothetical protein
MLNRLGWALTLMVFADLLENLFTFLAVTVARSAYPDLAPVLGAAMTVCSVLKIIGLLGVLVLCIFPKAWLLRA